MTIQLKVNGEWSDTSYIDINTAHSDGQISDGESYRVKIPVKAKYAYEEKVFRVPVDVPEFTISTPVITGAELRDGIYQNSKGQVVTITGSTTLPDGKMTLIIERVIDATRAVDDIRVEADILSGTFTTSFSFERSGNYLIRESRLNQGIERLGKGFKINLDSNLEFNCHA